MLSGNSPTSFLGGSAVVHYIKKNKVGYNQTLTMVIVEADDDINMGPHIPAMSGCELIGTGP